MSLLGSFAPPGDKSISHRLGLMSLLARGRVIVKNFSPCDDCRSTLGAVRALGGGVEEREGLVILTGAEGNLTPEADIDCGNSGTTMRLLMGILAGCRGRWTLDGDESLRRRPMERVAAPLRAMGAEVETIGGKPPVTIRGGGLKGAGHVLPVASAQLKSALLLAGLRAQGPSTVKEPAQSRDHTERLLSSWGIAISGENGLWRIEPGLPQLPPELTVPGDASSAAFFLVGAVITPGSRVRAENVLLNPTRDHWVKVLQRMGASLDVIPGGDDPEPWGELEGEFSPGLRATDIAPEEVPLLVDEVPILALAATQALGRSVFREVGELRIKESDRLAAVVDGLSALGARLYIEGENLVIEGPTPLRAPERRLLSFGDHRIAMTLEMAAQSGGLTLDIENRECAAVSYPGFAADLAGLRA